MPAPTTLVPTKTSPVCPECNGTGWKIVEREEVSGAERCGCVAVGRADRAIAAACIPPLYENASFENFLRVSDNAQRQRDLTGIFMQVRSYAKSFPLGKEPGLLLM